MAGLEGDRTTQKSAPRERDGRCVFLFASRPKALLCYSAVSGPSSEISPRLDASSGFIHAPVSKVADTAKMQITRFIITTSKQGYFRPLRNT
jgi:hypothetical protein